MSIEVACALGPRARLRGHDFDAVVMRGAGLVCNEAEIEEVVLDGGEAVEAEVDVDDLLGDLALGLVLRIEILEHGEGHAVVGCEFCLLKDQVLSREIVLHGIEFRPLLPWKGSRSRRLLRVGAVYFAD